MTKNSNKVELIEVARRYFGQSFGTAKYHDKSITCKDLVTDGIAIIYRASTTYENVCFTMDPEFTANTNIDEKTVKKACTPYMFMDRVTAPASLYGLMEVSQAKRFSLAMRDRWCAFYALDENTEFSVQDGANIDVDAPETRACMFDAYDVSKFFKRFKVTAVKAGLGPDFKSLEFEFVFKGETFRAVLLNCIDDETGAIQKSAELVESWAAEDAEREQATRKEDAEASAEDVEPAEVVEVAKAPAEKMAAMEAPKAPEQPENDGEQATDEKNKDKEPVFIYNYLKTRSKNMEVKCFCPYCAKSFTIEVEGATEPAKGRKAFTEEERAKRAERMRAMRAQGIGGRPKGSKNRAPRVDKGQPRGARSEQDPNVEWVDHAEGKPD